MGVFRNFPYSNFHEMNMDEIIKIIKNMLEEWARYHAEWDQWMADLEASWTEYQDDVNAQWAAYQNTMNTAWESMQNFINSYFDNLDVQEEINNKIVSMIQSGEFGMLVNEYIPPTVIAWLNANITEPEGVVIDTSLSVSGACADAKATGDAIINVESEIEWFNNKIFTLEQSDNIFNIETAETGFLINDGTVNTAQTAYKTSEFIHVKPNTNYIFVSFNKSNGEINNNRKAVALYDWSGNLIANSYQNLTNISGLAFNTGKAAFARVSSEFAYYDLYLKEGITEPSEYETFSEYYYNNLAFKTQSIPAQAIIGSVISSFPNNLYDPDDDVPGYIFTNGTIASSDTYNTTDFIPVIKDVTYLISPTCRFIGLYSENNENSFISRDSTEHTQDFYFESPITGFIRVSYNVNYGLRKITQGFEGEPVNKIEEGILLSDTQISQVTNLGVTKDILIGKKWVVCGDSFSTNGGTGTGTIPDGRYAGQPYVYPWIIGNRKEMEIVKFFEGGRTLAFPANPDTFTNSITCPTATWYYQNIPVDADYITFYLGINDEHHATGGGDGEDPTGVIPLGTIDDNTTATYYGAWNVVLSWLIENRPNAHIGIIVTNGLSIEAYRTAQIAIARKYGIPFIDMNGDDRTPAMLRTVNPNIPNDIKQTLKEKWSVDYPSNQHPNDAAQLYESAFIENFLRTI